MLVLGFLPETEIRGNKTLQANSLGNPFHDKALLVLSTGWLGGLQHESVHPAADVAWGYAHLKYGVR